MLVGSFEAESNAAMEKLAAELRRAGLNVEVYLGNIGKFDKQLRYADKLGIPLVVWQGPKEREQSAYAVKVLATKEQFSVAAEDLKSKLRDLLHATR
ncbi:MAG: His/Gly/Thr/Pro-type tRNA ligase C-terminal domain-containing protein [Candidatus Andersenbacteria bacterium]